MYVRDEGAQALPHKCKHLQNSWVPKRDVTEKIPTSQSNSSEKGN